MSNTIKNLTPHNINIVLTSGEIITIEKSGIIPRVASTEKLCGEINGIQIVETIWGEVIDLPTAEEGVTLIVSTLVKEKANRSDLVSPNGLVRDSAGIVIGCKGLSR